MYLPPQFAAKDPDIARELMRAHPFASLISTDDDGLPFVTHLPLHLLDEEAGLVLLGHVARPNPHAKFLRERPKAVVTFMGPHAYMTPRVYPDLARVPTWNYIAVHCTVQARTMDGFDDKDRLLKHLIHDHDPAYADQWRGLGEDYQHKMMQGIVAFELQVTELQCKVKLNQHRPESHAAMLDAYEHGNGDEQALAGWMRRLKLTGQGA
ncbi:FMN-binding negative transcriptional regulator [Hydrogenophaga sp.]|uniref:FMN-binding negative transcriptional regulator n=1 Tax=Hydrogenophaga sp. TaxID=1904254 RepID=UPI00272F9948|nr:FMN-binding negative transcriptional regulator [Hydrogenophaga sp.]MDP2016279.1 FMN-binding negative transcriptional regulator [Hydrogenophaga sp.]MDP3165043.1 FMN-binding negative transcriptional regulator [Hydrogenophaga sp.]MDP3811640.1 FMN-binding negative transcriptional regulator [Hydrogenophaga sp.]